MDKLREEIERTQATLGKSQLQQDKLQNSLDKAQTEVDHLQERLDKQNAESRRLQLEREKQMYDFENLQSQLDKALGQAARIQKERESIGMDSERLRDKAEKAQVIYGFFFYYFPNKPCKFFASHSSMQLVCKRNETPFRTNWTVTRNVSKITRALQ